MVQRCRIREILLEAILPLVLLDVPWLHFTMIHQVIWHWIRPWDVDTSNKLRHSEVRNRIHVTWHGRREQAWSYLDDFEQTSTTNKPGILWTNSKTQVVLIEAKTTGWYLREGALNFCYLSTVRLIENSTEMPRKKKKSKMRDIRYFADYPNFVPYELINGRVRYQFVIYYLLPAHSVLHLAYLSTLCAIQTLFDFLDCTNDLNTTVVSRIIRTKCFSVLTSFRFHFLYLLRSVS